LSGYFEDKEPKELRARTYLVAAFAAAAFFLLATRVWYLQVKEGGRYRELSLNNSVRLVKSPAGRGLIFDRNDIKLADNRPGFDLYIVPEDVLDWAKTKDMLSRLAGVDGTAIDEKIRKAARRPAFQAVKLAEDLSWEETVKIEGYKFETPGVMLEVAPKRAYLYGEAVSHLIGYLGEISDRELSERRAGGRYALGDLVGRYGIEDTYEAELKGTDGGREILVDALGRKIRDAAWLTPYPGSDMRLTIDLKTQLAAWEALKDKVGAAVAIEPRTGKVLALVSTPGFDPNALTTGISSDEWQALITNPSKILTNRAIQGLYPPASTFKPVHAAAALEEKVINPSTRIYSGAAFGFAGRQYRDWKEEGHGVINLHRAIVESSDTFFYQVGLKLGVDRLARYSKRFGFGARTGVDLRDEKAGLVPTSEWKKKALGERWYEGETISVSVGQGYMLATPIQLASAYASLANGGVVYAPQTVEEIRSPSGEMVRGFTPRIKGRLNISESTLAEVKRALAGVVHEDGGTASFLRTAGLNIAGKTGTAQVRRLVDRTKDVEKIAYRFRDHAWFAGYAPYDDPRIAVAVLVEHGGFGASAAAPIAREMFSAYLGAASHGGAAKAAPAAVAAGAQTTRTEAH
jgi:penicillin-binding protein 2